MSVAQTIKSQLKSKIQACDSVQHVYSNPHINPEGWPSVFLTMARIEGEFSSSAENSRVYTYNAMGVFPIGQDMPGLPVGTDRLEFAEETLETVVDEIINEIDTDFELDGSPVLYTQASDVEWGYYDYEGGEARAAQVTLSVYTEKLVT